MNIDVLLQNYVDSGDLKGAILMSDDGTILLSRLPGRLSTRLVEMIQWIKNTVYDISPELQRNRLQRVIYTLSDAILMFTQVGGGIVLVAIAEPESDINHISYLSTVYSKAIMAETHGTAIAGKRSLI